MWPFKTQQQSDIDTYERYIKKVCADYPRAQAQFMGPAGKELRATLGVPEDAPAVTLAQLEANMRKEWEEMTPEQRHDGAVAARKLLGIR